ncbi:hypothetical protein ACNOYE_10330 [Nannocystaceae bacterium ST9]
MRRKPGIRSISFAILALTAFCPLEAEASPGVDGTRNLSMGNATRGSSAGTQAALINPAGLMYGQQFAIEGMYQYNAQTRTHGMGVFISDSLNTPRIALALGYVFMRGDPRLRYTDALGERKDLGLVHFGHEVSGVLSVAAVKNWLYLGVKPKWQYSSLRYLDDDGKVHDFRRKLNAFGLDIGLALNLLDWAKIAVVGYNLTGPAAPAYTEDKPVTLDGVAVDPDDPAINTTNVRRLSDYPRSLGHGLAIFPLRKPDFSINVDATYDFTSYWNQNKYTRVTVNAGAEFVAGPVPIRVGGWWDSRGRGNGDDRGYVSAGLGYFLAPKVGGVGVDIAAGFAQQVTGSPRAQLDTVIGVNIGIRLHPDL